LFIASALKRIKAWTGPRVSRINYDKTVCRIGDATGERQKACCRISVKVKKHKPFTSLHVLESQVLQEMRLPCPALSNHRGVFEPADLRPHDRPWVFTRRRAENQT